MTMSNGPGKYDALATFCRINSNARGVVVMVIEGRLGTGFSVQTDPATLAKLPDILETMAAGIRADLDAAPPVTGQNP